MSRTSDLGFAEDAAGSYAGPRAVWSAWVVRCGLCP